MVEVVVESVRKPIKNENLRVIILEELDGARKLPIWMGAPQGDSIILQLKDDPTIQPRISMTYDIIKRLLDLGGLTLKEVAITRIEDATYYAKLRLTRENGDQVLEEDSRPSDAINIALRVGAPILVDEAVMQNSGIRPPSPDELEDPTRISVLRRREKEALQDTVAEELAPEVKKRAMLRQQMVARFNTSELSDLCFDLGIDHEGFPRQVKGDFVRELIAHFIRREELPLLETTLRQLRPSVSWD
jgi:bifunctional DNase/RNase